MAGRSSTGTLSKNDQKVVNKYLKLVKGSVSGPLTVWVTRDDEGLLHFHTLVGPGIESLREAIRAEMELLDEVDPFTVDFDFYGDPDVESWYFRDLPPVLRRS